MPIISLFMATMAQGQPTCTFTTECFEGESCAETAFSFAYKITACPRMPGPRYIEAQTGFGDLTGGEIGSTCTGSAITHEGGEYVLTGDGATYLLSLSDGDARLTAHMTGPISITYIGQCEATD